MEYAQKMAPEKTAMRYVQKGKKLEMIADRNTYNGGLWIYEDIKYNDAGDHVEVSSFAYRMKADFDIKMFAGDHYCKLLTPFKALEWIYVDSQYGSTQELAGFMQ